MGKPPAKSQPEQGAADSQRREFLKKLLWVPPLILTLSMKEDELPIEDPMHPLHREIYGESGSPPPPP
ncbi:hypothetical protein ACFLQU_02025 [Verrucomicrobiota bacterium]